jgi:hypothetical protein
MEKWLKAKSGRKLAVRLVSGNGMLPIAAFAPKTRR